MIAQRVIPVTYPGTGRHGGIDTKIVAQRANGRVYVAIGRGSQRANARNDLQRWNDVSFIGTWRVLWSWRRRPEGRLASEESNKE
jgi:hypothetical protein